MTKTDKLAKEIAGKTIRWTWTDGPTKGTTQEHHFLKDGRVKWKVVEGGKPCDAEEKEYAALKIGADAVLVSYLGSSGYTLTVALDLKAQTMVGIASGAKDWYPGEGTFEFV